MKKMTRPLIQIDDEVREMNDEELAAHQLMIDAEKAKEAEATAKADAKAVLLDRLGITAEEATLLLG
jgi:nicotinate-nucleotide pyrophosphorylase